jgi:hypothetical protein
MMIRPGGVDRSGVSEVGPPDTTACRGGCIAVPNEPEAYPHLHTSPADCARLRNQVIDVIAIGRRVKNKPGNLLRLPGLYQFGCADRI